MSEYSEYYFCIFHIMIGKKLIYIAQVNDKRYLHHWTVMSCTSSTSNVLLCGELSRSDCEIYDPRSIARQISDVFNAMIRCNKKYPGRSYSRIKTQIMLFSF